MGDRMITRVRLYKKERRRPASSSWICWSSPRLKIPGTDTARRIALWLPPPRPQRRNLPAQWESQLFLFSSPPKFNGFDYALLTKNLTCTMCHMRVRSRSLLDNMAAVAADPSQPKNLYGNFDRVKVASPTSWACARVDVFDVRRHTIPSRHASI